MAKYDFVKGSETVENFFHWINERHRIYLKKKAGEAKPWTTDSAMRIYKFTNVFRELDTGTLALRLMIMQEQTDPTGFPTAGDIAWNIVWYRMLNWHKHTEEPGFCYSFEKLSRTMRAKDIYGEKVFTGCHLTVGQPGERKIETNLRTMEAIFERRKELAEVCRKSQSLQVVWKFLQQFRCIGPFISYEIVSDFRWYDCLLSGATDIMTWANHGPGCHRGLDRLGMAHTMASLKMLWSIAPQHLEPHVLSHHPIWVKEQRVGMVWPPFELREIEHSLCEFDKWRRASLKEGRPCERYRGV